MKTPAISADLAVKLAIGAAVAGLLWIAYRRAQDAAAGLADAAREAAQTARRVADDVIAGTNPANPDNVVNKAVTAAGSALVSPTGPGRNADGSWNLGGAWFDLINWGWDRNLSTPNPGLPAPGRAAGSAPLFNPQTEELTHYDALGNPTP